MIRTVSLLISFLSFAGILLFFTFCSSEKKPEQQELTAPVTFAAHQPGVKYTGTKSCISCHQDVYETYQHTGKGRSFYEPSRSNIIEDFNKALVYDKPSNYYYRAFWKGNEMFIAEFRLSGRDTTHFRQEKVDFIVGSGNQTRTYIWEQNGYYFELPITWYVAKGIWDMSPGYEDGHNTRFNRPIGDMCMNCHNSEQQFVPNSINKFTAVGLGMSCEKCHGPGEAHVKARTQGQQTDAGAVDFTIVNPGKLPIQLQFDVCRQCHLEGIAVPKAGKDITDYKPGIPLNTYYDVFLPVSGNTEQFGFASHAERLQMSPCFVQSAGKLTCTSCHDPHKPLPKDEVLFYNQKCQSCHQPADCNEHPTLRAKNGDNCAGCHMPKSGTTDIPHVSSTDYFIRRKPSDTQAQKAGSTGKSGELMRFKSFTSDVGETDRAYLLLNMIYFEQHEQNPAYLDRISNYIHQLDTDNQIKYAFLKETPLPENLRALQPSQVSNAYTASYIAEINRKNNLPYLAWAHRAVELAPANIEFQVLYAKALYNSGNKLKSREVYHHVLELNPHHSVSLANLGFLYLEEQDFDQALSLTNRAIKSDPDYLLPQENMATIYLQKGEYRKGLEQLDKLIGKNPNNERYKALRARVIEAL